MDMEIAFYLFSLPLFSCYHLSWEVPPLEICCHTRLHFASFSLQDGATEWLCDLAWTTPSPHPQLSFFCQCCAVSPPQQIMCGVPTPIRYVRCPHLNKVGAASPPSSIYFFCAVSPPFATLGSVLDSISKVENLASSSL